MSPASPGLIAALPFIGLLLTVAVAPMVAPGRWHRHYGLLCGAWALAFLLPSAVLRGGEMTLATLTAVVVQEYLPFILLLGALFVIAGGLRVTGLPRGSPGVNTVLLAFGTVLASAVGTTGATLVMLRPLLRANRHRRQAAHVFVFFIFLVANVGGALTPLGNPPIFLGFLLGVPFLWPALHLALPSAALTATLLAIFYVLDTLRHRRNPAPAVLPELEKLGIQGGINLLLLVAAIAIVLLRAVWHPSATLTLAGVGWNVEEIVADGLYLLVALLSLALTPPAIRRANAFAWAPMIEVAILFAAIFITLAPVTAIIAAGAAGPAAPLFARLMPGGVPDNAVFYWVTGTLSALLDNAPTYVVFFGFAGGDPAVLTGPLAGTLAALSAGAVYFGAMSYLGNAPNFMVRSIVEADGIRMPGFFGYIGWAMLYLLPCLWAVEWLLPR